jgi:hypothetical protein
MEFSPPPSLLKVIELEGYLLKPALRRTMPED